MDDWKQLKDYAQNGNEKAFATLMNRHIGLVYGVAVRKLGDTARAEEVTQAVFLTLAQQASTLKRQGTLSTWLYSTASHKAIDLLRTDTARKRREQAHGTLMQEDPSSNSHEVWLEIAPHLEEAMSTLGENDRTAVLLRYFEERPLREVSQALGISETATRKRVSRALERLRNWYSKRGINCTSGALGIAIGAFAVQSMPAATAASAVQAVLAQASAAPAASSFSTTLATSIMTMKLPLITGILAGVAVPLSLGYFEEAEAPATSAAPLIASKTNEIVLPEPAMSSLMAEWMKLRSEYGPDGGSMMQLYQAVENLDDDFRRRSFRTAVMAEWATLDPEGALAYFKETKKKSRIADVLKVWLENNPSDALAAIKAQAEDFKGPIGRLLPFIAEDHPDELASLAGLISDGRIAQSFLIAARDDLPGMRESALEMSGRARTEALAGVGEAWAEQDAPAAMAWAQALESSEDRSRALRHVLIGWASSDPVAALENMNIAPPGGVGTLMIHERATSEEVLKAAANKDFDATLDWLAQNGDAFEDSKVPGLSDPLQERLMNDVQGTLAMMRDHEAQPFLVESLSSILMNHGGGLKDDIWKWANDEPHNAFTGTLKKELLRDLMIEDSGNAAKLARERIAKGEVETISFPLLANLVVKHPDDLQTFSDIFDHAPQDARDDAIAWSLMPDRVPDIDHDALLGWMDQLPQPLRDKVSESRVAALAANDPASAIDWANGLPESDRIKAYEGLTKTWSSADSYETSQWIANLPAGAERDAATLALVQTVAPSEPDSAWQWAQDIQSPSQRIAALQQSLIQFKDSARDVLENSNLPNDEKAQLQDWLTSNNATNTP